MRVADCWLEGCNGRRSNSSNEVQDKRKMVLFVMMDVTFQGPLELMQNELLKNPVVTETRVLTITVANSLLLN